MKANSGKENYADKRKYNEYKLPISESRCKMLSQLVREKQYMGGSLFALLVLNLI